MVPVIRPDCPCPKVSCRRHKLCDECEAVHAPKGGLPYCRRPHLSFWERVCRLLGLRR